MDKSRTNLLVRTRSNVEHVVADRNNISLVNLGGLRKAPVSWKQDDDTVTLTVFLPGVTEYRLETVGIYGHGWSGIQFNSVTPKGYGFEIKLLGKIRDIDNKDHCIIGQSVKIKLKKLSPGLLWPRLYLKGDNEKFPWLKMEELDPYFTKNDCDVVGLNVGLRYVSAALANELKDAKKRESVQGFGFTDWDYGSNRR